MNHSILSMLMMMMNNYDSMWIQPNCTCIVHEQANLFWAILNFFYLKFSCFPFCICKEPVLFFSTKYNLCEEQLETILFHFSCNKQKQQQKNHWNSEHRKNVLMIMMWSLFIIIRCKTHRIESESDKEKRETEGKNFFMRGYDVCKKKWIIFVSIVFKDIFLWRDKNFNSIFIVGNNIQQRPYMVMKKIEE